MGVLALLLCLVPLCAWGQKPPIVVPDDPGVVVERLPEGYAELMPGSASLTPTVPRVMEMLEVGARTGDARLIARAEQRLRAGGATSDPERLFALAYAAQYRHDFQTARRLIDRLLELDPRNGPGRLARAQILLVTGEVAAAHADCQTLAFGIDSGRGTLCLAMVQQRIGRSESAGRLLDLWLGRRKEPGSALRRHVLVMRAEAAGRNGDADADQWFERALAVAPHDVRTLSAFSRYLRTHGRSDEALALLEDAPQTDHLFLERALVARTAAPGNVAALTAELARRYRMGHEIGLPPDLRDEAEFLLTFQGDAAPALALARRNFEHQRDYEDVSLLCRTAAAANRPAALGDLHAWANAQELELPALCGDSA